MRHHAILRALPLLVLAAFVVSALPAQAGLVSLYDFEDSGTPGIARDPVGGHDGAISGGAFYTAQSQAGIAGMFFDGSGQITVPYHSDFDISTFSISAWVNIETEQGNGGILGTRFGGDTTFDVKVRSSDIHGDVGSGGGWINTSVDIRSTDTGSNGQGGDLAHDTWYLVTYVIDDVAKQFRLYLDDDLKRTIGYGGTPRLMKPGQTLRIGNSSGGEFLNDGFLDDVRIYNHALTLTEIEALAASVPSALGGGQIADLFNTGVDASGAALVGGTPAAPVNDPHYDLVEFAGALVAPTPAFAAEDDNFPIPPWIVNDADSRWIDPTGREDSFGPAGQYTYRTIFTIPAEADLSTVILEGDWATDNPGVDILINGTPTGLTNTAQFGTLTHFGISSGFVHGQNTLDFVLANAGTGDGPTGLRVDNLIATYRVPEPGTLCLLGLGGLLLRRRRRS